MVKTIKLRSLKQKLHLMIMDGLILGHGLTLLPLKTQVQDYNFRETLMEKKKLLLLKNQKVMGKQASIIMAKPMMLLKKKIITKSVLSSLKREKTHLMSLAKR